MKKIFLPILLFVLSLVSCSAEAKEIPAGALAVNAPSEEVHYLMPGDYPDSYAEDGESFKWGYNVFVSKLNNSDTLLLSGNRNEGLGRTALTDSGTYYKSGDWFGCAEGVFLNFEKVIDEECVGMVASMNQGNEILIITNTKDNSYVYSAKRAEEQWVVDEHPMELGAPTKFIYYDWPLYPIMSHAPSDVMYVITERDLILLSVGEYLDAPLGESPAVTKTVVKTPAYWHYLRPTSAVMLNDRLYIGDMFGVLAFDESTKDFTYYPADIRAKK